jgi:hypothetical protein
VLSVVLARKQAGEHAFGGKNVFSPSGRMMQIEYASEIVERGHHIKLSGLE